MKDTDTNLIWLRDWNVNGQKNWGTQRDWALGLDFAGRTDWRLPEIGECGALFTTNGDLTSVAAFKNVQDNHWSGTVASAGRNAWFFFPDPIGFQGVDDLTSQYFAVAVRPGDVTASVPEPRTLSLAMLALGVTAVAHRGRAR